MWFVRRAFFSDDATQITIADGSETLRKDPLLVMVVINLVVATRWSTASPSQFG